MQDAGVPVRYVIPKEGLYANLDYFSIPAGRRTGISLSTCSTLRSSLRLNAPSAPTCITARRTEGCASAALPRSEWVWRADELRKLKFENAQYVASKTDEWTDRWNEWRASL